MITRYIAGQELLWLVFYGIAAYEGFNLHLSRGSRARTRSLRFWRPTLYRLSYTPL
jgi:hypothetical protein